MEEQINKLREAGFSDSDIQEWMADQNRKQTATNNTQPNGPVSPTEQDVPFKIQPTTIAPENNSQTNMATGFQAGNAFLHSPIGGVVEGAAAYGLGKYAFDKFVNSRRAQPTPGSPGYPIGGSPQTAAAAAEQAGPLTRTAQNLGYLAGRYGPALSNIAKIGGVAAAGMTPGTLNAGEDQAMAQMRQFQTNFSKLPTNQQTAYYNLPRNKQQQVSMMIRNGQDPSSVLGQTNALTSGFAQQLNRLGN
jgi:hypothetical protein